MLDGCRQAIDLARAVLEEIAARFPDSEQSLQAAQRLAHLASQTHLLEPQERKPIKLPPGRRESIVKAVRRLDEIAVRDLASLLG